MFTRQPFMGSVVAPLYERDPHVDTDRWIRESLLWETFEHSLEPDEVKVVIAEVAMVFPDVNRRVARGWAAATDRALLAYLTLRLRWQKAPGQMLRLGYEQVEWVGPSVFGDGSLQIRYIDREQPPGGSWFLRVQGKGAADFRATLRHLVLAYQMGEDPDAD